MQPLTLDPIHDDPRLEGAKRQQDLFTDIHDDPLLLRSITWERSGNRRGFIETQELERQALVNDFEFHGIPIQIRLENLQALRDLRDDQELTELRVAGPGRQSAAFPQMKVPDEVYVITEEWRDFPAFFANWLNHACAERPELGAPYAKAIRVRQRDDNGEESVSYRHEPRPGTRLFRWRTPADAAATGERDSGLVVPGSFSMFAGGDEEEVVEATGKTK